MKNLRITDIWNKGLFICLYVSQYIKIHLFFTFTCQRGVLFSEAVTCYIIKLFYGGLGK